MKYTMRKTLLSFCALFIAIQQRMRAAKITKDCCFQNSLPADNFKKYMACFKCRAFDVPNALQTIDNEAFQLIIYCF